MLEDTPKDVRVTITKLQTGSTESGADSGYPEPPRCTHGSALRFSRYDKKTGDSRDFYACSVSRDRKLCRLFYWVDDWNRKTNRHTPIPIDAASEPTRQKRTRYDANLGIDTLVDNSSNAQFTFDRQSISTIVALCENSAETASKSRILCVGTPSIHLELTRKGVSSILLDIDERLSSVCGSVYRYNMFTGEFLDSRTSIADDFSAIVCDPPFHPELYPALFDSLKKSFPNSYESSMILFASPYFFQEQISAACPRLENMTDIRLTYSNHKKYVAGNRSPVRLFASCESLRTILTCVPKGYHICESCDDVVSDYNLHCNECKRCTSIAGNTHYKHCRECRKCVKASAVHCDSCNRCFIRSPHTCSQ